MGVFQTCWNHIYGLAFSLSLHCQEGFSQGSERSDNLFTPSLEKFGKINGSILDCLNYQWGNVFVFFFSILADLLIGPKGEKHLVKMKPCNSWYENFT